MVAACGSVLKPPAPNRRLDISVSGAVFESGNGYRFVAIPDPSASIIRVDVRYPVGAADDPPGKEGLAHLVEHLLFDIEIPAAGGRTTSISAELGRTAIGWNAITAEDSTTYQTEAAPDALDAILKLEVDRLAVGCKGLTKDIVAREREVVLNELRERQGVSGAAVERVIDDAVFPAGHPYRKVDSVDTVAKLTLDDVCAFLAGAYQRDKAIVVVSGAIAGEDLQTAASHHYGRLGNRVTTAHAVPPVVTANPGTVTVKADVDDTTVVATWPMPAMSTRDYRLLELAMPAIALRTDSFAFTYRWGHDAGWTVLGGAYAPVLAVWVELDSADKVGDAKEALAKSAEFAARVVNADDKASPDWVNLWHGQAEMMLASWETLAGRNAMFADYLQLTPDDTGYLIGRVDELTKATPKETYALVRSWLAPSAARYIVLEPSGMIGRSTQVTYAGGAEEHAVSADPALADQPLPVPAAKLALDTVRFTTGNGLTVVLWPNGTQPLVHGRLVIDSGSAHDPANNEGVATLVGASSVSADNLVFSRRDLSTNVDDTILALGLELRSPGYELDDDDKDYLRGQLHNRRSNERATYERDLTTAVYGDGHPYARGGMTEDSLDHIHRDLVMDWARGHIVPKNATLIVAGKFDPELVKKHIAYNTDQVSDGNDSPDIAVAPHSTATRVTGYSERPSPTVELDVAFPGGSGLDRNYAKRLVLESLLASMLESLRGQQAVTYGMSVRYIPRVAGGMWRITGDVDANRAAEAAATVIATLDRIRSDPESYRAAFVLARQQVLSSLLATTGDAGAIADRLEFVARFDLPDTFYDQLANDVSGLTLKDMPRFIASELDVDDQVVGAFGNKDAVDAALAAARSGEGGSPVTPDW